MVLLVTLIFIGFMYWGIHVYVDYRVYHYPMDRIDFKKVSDANYDGTYKDGYLISGYYDKDEYQKKKEKK